MPPRTSSGFTGGRPPRRGPGTGDPDEVLYGLYIGTPLPDRGADYGNTTPDVIALYRGPLEEDFPDREELIYEIEVTLVHEIAHYFGFAEEILERYGYD